MKTNHYKKRYLVVILVALIFTACNQSAKATSMHLVKATGTVDIFDEAGDSVTYMEELGLYSGYHINTNLESYAWIDLDRVKLTKMDAASEVEIQKKGKALEVVVHTGSLYFNITEPLLEDESLNIRSSTMMVGIRGTKGWVHAQDETHFYVFLLEGTVECQAVNTEVYGNNIWEVNAGEKAEFLCTEDRIEATIEPITASDIPAFVIEEGLPETYEELLAEEESSAASEDTEAMPEPTPGGGIANMYGTYMRADNVQGAIQPSSSPSMNGADEIILHLDEKTAKFAAIEQVEENVYRGIGPYDTQVYWIVFDSEGMQVTALAAADEDFQSRAGYYKQIESYNPETGERIPVTSAE
ncbi:MAG: FecR domain-containing protein [Lachnospiraceae bacterium]|nr:FecR domain-containing protein [Lachnospiraceae bacterium]